jgi:rhodanese-related sulfurtransferase
MKTIKKLIAIVTCLCAISASAGEFPDISIKDLKKAIKEKKVIVIDVNGTNSYNKGHVPTAIDFSAKDTDLEKVLKDKDKETLVVAYCGGPSCGAYMRAASKAKALGFTNVKHLSAGISGWLQAGEKTEKAKKAKKKDA